jgi:hypothetical protein
MPIWGTEAEKYLGGGDTGDIPLREKVFGGFVSGLREDPFTKPIVDALAGVAGVDQFQLERMGRRLQGKTASQAASFIGEYGPTLLLGMGIWGGGKIVGAKLIQAASKRIAAQEGKGLLGRMAAKVGLEKQIGMTAKVADDIIGGATPIQGTPMLQRTAEIGVGNLALSGMVGAQEKARGKTDEEALKSAAIVMAIGVGADFGLTTLGKVLTPKARAYDVAEQVARFDQPGPGGKIPREVLEKELKTRTGEVAKLNEKIRTVLGVDAQQMSLFKSTSPKLARMPEEIQGKVAELQRQKKALFREIKGGELEGLRVGGLKQMLEHEGTIPFASRAPYNPTGPMSGFRKMVSQIGMQAWSAPESWFGKFGASGRRIMTQTQYGVDSSEIYTRALAPILSQLAVKTYKGLGISSRQAKRGGFLESSHIYETQGEDALRKWLIGKGRTAKQADDVVEGYTELTKMYDMNQMQGAQYGMKPRISLDGSHGVIRYHSHASRDVSDDLLREHLVKAGFDEVEITKIVKHRGMHVDGPDVDPLVGVGGGTTPRVGPLDFDRVHKGSLKQKFEAGIPVNPNPFDTAFQVLSASNRRFALDPIIGHKGRNIDALVATVKAEGGDEIAFRTMLDAVVGRKYYNEAMRNAANFMGGLQVTAKLPLAVFANMTQPQNTLAMVGFRNAAKGYLSLTRKQTREEFTRAMGIHHHMVKGIGRSVDDEGLFLGPTEMMADWTLRVSQFDRFERWNRMHGGSAALVTIRDTIAKAESGRLRGKNLDFGRRLLGELGMDLDGIVAKQKATGRKYVESMEYRKLETLAAIRGAQRTQFFPGKTRRPIFWSHPIGRTMMQFKTFALGQSRFLRDAVLAEAAQGNVAPLATFLAVAPVSGEVVGNIRNFIKGTDRNTEGIMRYFDNISYVGGLGLATDALGAARWGDLEGVFFGPTFGDFVSFGEALLQGNVQAILREGARQPAFQAGRFLLGVGVVTAEEIDRYLENTESIPEGEYTTLEELRFNQTQNKR